QHRAGWQLVAALQGPIAAVRGLRVQESMADAGRGRAPRQGRQGTEVLGAILTKASAMQGESVAREVGSGSQPAMEAIETAGIEELQALQLKRLRWTLQHAFEHVRHYKDRFAAAGVEPADLQQLGDLPRFPFTLKQDLRDNYPFGMLAVARDQVARVHAS